MIWMVIGFHSLYGIWLAKCPTPKLATIVFVVLGDHDLLQLPLQTLTSKMYYRYRFFGLRRAKTLRLSSEGLTQKYSFRNQ